MGAENRGAFNKIPITGIPTYPGLWSHDAQREKRMVCLPDCELQAKIGMEAKANRIWAFASRTHITQDFGLGSQPLMAAFTEEVSIGGRAWPNVKFPDPRYDYAFVLWCNSTLGLLLFWWEASRQQDGRAITTITKVGSLPTLDLRELTDQQFATAKEIFDDFRYLDLKPAYLADCDKKREMLDRQVMCDLLGYDKDTFRAVRNLTRKWCTEPSVHGGKKRPSASVLSNHD